MNKKVKQLATVAITASLVSALAVPAFAGDTIASVDAINSIVVESNSGNFIERGLQSRYIEDHAVYYWNADITSEVPKTYEYNKYEGGYIWKGTLKLTNYRQTDTTITAYYSGYVYAYEE